MPIFPTSIEDDLNLIPDEEVRTEALMKLADLREYLETLQLAVNKHPAAITAAVDADRVIQSEKGNEADALFRRKLTELENQIAGLQLDLETVTAQRDQLDALRIEMTQKVMQVLQAVGTEEFPALAAALGEEFLTPENRKKRAALQASIDALQAELSQIPESRP